MRNGDDLGVDPWADLLLPVLTTELVTDDQNKIQNNPVLRIFK